MKMKKKKKKEKEMAIKNGRHIRGQAGENFFFLYKESEREREESAKIHDVRTNRQRLQH